MVVDKSKFVITEFEAQCKCKVCGGILRPVKEFVLAFKTEFTQMLGHEPTFPEFNWNCIECGLIYDNKFNNTGNIVSWFPALKKYYQLENSNLKGGNDK